MIDKLSFNQNAVNNITSTINKNKTMTTISTLNELMKLQSNLATNNSLKELGKSANKPKSFALENLEKVESQIRNESRSVLMTRTALNLNLIILNRNGSRLLVKHIELLLRNVFLSINCLISQPIYELTGNVLTIKLFYYYASISPKKSKSSKKYRNTKKGRSQPKIKKIVSLSTHKAIVVLASKLSEVLNRQIIIELIGLHSPQLETKILGNTISIITDRIKRNFRKTVTRIINGSPIVNHINIKQTSNPTKLMLNNIAGYTGINFRLAGRLTRQSIIPKRTVKTIQRGSTSRKRTELVTIAQYTAKNRKGIFCFTISIGHAFY